MQIAESETQLAAYPIESTGQEQIQGKRILGKAVFILCFGLQYGMALLHINIRISERSH